MFVLADKRERDDVHSDEFSFTSICHLFFFIQNYFNYFLHICNLHEFQLYEFKW